MSRKGIAKGETRGIANDVATKRSFALQLRRDGYSYEVIGRMLKTQFATKHPRTGEGFTAVYASKLVHQAIKDIYREDAKALVTLELERLDAMQLEAIEVLRTEHVLVSGGEIVSTFVRDEHGNVLFDQTTGKPATAPIRDDGPRLAAIDRLLKIQERRSRLLGLDKPTKVANTNPDGDKPAVPYVIVATKEDQAL